MGDAAVSANPWIILPFGMLLALMALAPMYWPNWWSRHYAQAACSLAAVTLVYYLFGLRAWPRVLHMAHDYVSFIVLTGSLFVVSGGIHLNIKGEATPAANVLFLFFGALLANVLGTTGASMLLIRPWLRMNHCRVKAHHVVFFIFIVSNVGGCLTPIGDPPLFLGYLKGVPFWWVAQHCWPMWAVATGFLLAVFYAVDSANYRRAPRKGSPLDAAGSLAPSEGERVGVRGPFAPSLSPPERGEGGKAEDEDPPSHGSGAASEDEKESRVREQGASSSRLRGRTPFGAAKARPSRSAGEEREKIAPAHNTWRFEGLWNIPFLLVILGAVFINHPPFLREGLMAAAAAGSYFSTGRQIHAANYFEFHPLWEVAVLFAGIFATMIPALDWLYLNASRLASPSPGQFYLGSGLLSSLLDSAPAYLGFLNAAVGRFDGPAIASQSGTDQSAVTFLLSHPDLSRYVLAISLGAVFFGANTYIGNGPNFMVKAIADHQKVRTPGFLGLVFRYTVPYMVPMLALIWWLFLR